MVLNRIQSLVEIRLIIIEESVFQGPPNWKIKLKPSLVCRIIPFKARSSSISIMNSTPASNTINPKPSHLETKPSECPARHWLWACLRERRNPWHGVKTKTMKAEPSPYVAKARHIPLLPHKKEIKAAERRQTQRKHEVIPQICFVMRIDTLPLILLLLYLHLLWDFEGTCDRGKGPDKERR